MSFSPPTARYEAKDQRQLRLQVDRAVQAVTPLFGTYLPVITSSGGGETITYTTQLGQWVRLPGNLVWFVADVVVATKSGGSGDILVSVPVPAPSGPNQVMAAYVDNMAAGWTGAPSGTVDAGTATVKVRELVAGNAAGAWGRLAVGCRIRLSGVYLAA